MNGMHIEKETIMSVLQRFGVAVLVGATVAASACEREAEQARQGAGVVIDETEEAAEKTADATRDIAAKAVDKTKEMAAATGEAITDGWITTRIHGRFVDETLLKGSDIDVDTRDHVVTLKGTVTSDAAKGRAAAVARTVQGVDHVVNLLVVHSN
jgi:hyperosmotically inducible periplasmic protein